MKDIQSLHDTRRINIRKVGVKTISYPIMVLDKASSTQRTVARVNMYVNLPHRFKGTHMSRFVEILNQFHGAFDLTTFQLILQEMKHRLEAEAAHLEMEFPYFLPSDETQGEPGPRRYICRLHGSLEQQLDLRFEVDIPVPLPVHPQSEGLFPSTGLWGEVTASVRMHRFLWIEDLIALIEQGALFPQHFPDTVESMCRRIGVALRANETFQWYKVVVKNFSSGYSTFASSEWPDPEAAEPSGLPAAVD